MQTTILLFGGDNFYAEGGALDLLGVVPFVDSKMIFNVMCDVIEKKFDNAPGSYWCNVAIVGNGTARKHKHWRLTAGTDLPEQQLVSALHRTQPGKALTVCMEEDHEALDVDDN